MAVSLHALVLLAGARLGLREPAEVPAESPAAPGELLVDVTRAPLRSNERRPEGDPAGVKAGPRGTARPGTGREPGIHFAPRSSTSGPAEEQAGGQDRFDDRAASYLPTVLPGERSGVLAALAIAFRRQAGAPPAIRDPAAARGRGGNADHGAGGGEGGSGRKSSRKPGEGGWGDSWDYVVGPHGREIARPASLLDSGTRAGEVTLTYRTIHAAVGRSAGRLRTCHDDGRRRDASLAGRILVRFSVDPRGSVLVAANAGSTVADPVVIRCVLAAFAAMTFPARPDSGAAQGAYLIAYPPGR